MPLSTTLSPQAPPARRNMKREATASSRNEQEKVVSHSTSQLVEAMRACHDRLSDGDVALHGFPAADGNASNAEIRPCPPGRRRNSHAMSCVGPAAQQRRALAREIRVSSAAASAAAGLDKATGLVGAWGIEVPLGGAGFDACSGTGSPVIVRLDGRPCREALAQARPAAR